MTQPQKTAITTLGQNLQIIACAGSGKTEVVAQRVVNLLRPSPGGGALPRNILAFTYTDRAAAELKDRIVTRCREELGAIPGLAEMFVGTIHAFCLDLLKTEVPEYLKYEVLGEVQQGLFIDRNSSSSGLTRCRDLSGTPLKRYRDTQHYMDVLTILREADPNWDVLRDSSILQGLEAYRSLLTGQCYLDYSAILFSAIEELTGNDGLRARLAERVFHLIVDEYQDVNPIQEAIVWTLHDLGAKICVVGDDDQTIYQWRGSDVQNILTFSERYPSVAAVPLEDNFRSSEGIVRTAQAFIERVDRRLPKVMRPTGAQGDEAGDLVALSFPSVEDEARYIARTAQALLGTAIHSEGDERGISWSDMAVLLRSVKANGRVVTQALSEAGVPFIVVGMNNLFDTPEAEAARQIFYFMAEREGADEASLRGYWIEADLGIAEERLSAAIETLKEHRALFENPTERFGFYSIQRTFMTFLEEAGLREDAVPGGRGEIVFYNLGKFSQVISDFETIHYHSNPKEKYASFADFLHYRAEDAYPEGWQENQYANPDAVRVMTIHQAKGMQWPVVFIPTLLRNRFPSKRQGGRSVWHLIPKEGIQGQARYEGSIEDERRLFYVAMTRSQKHLHLTWAPIPGNKLFQHPSQFWEEILASKWVKRKPQEYQKRRRLPPQPRAGVANVVLTFSDIKYFFECPYQFKLRILYGFNAPIHEALGYGKSLHNALAEVHARAQRGERPEEALIPELVDRHLHIPYAFASLREHLSEAASAILENYLRDNRALFDKIEFSEKQVEINLGDGISVNGRIDLVRRIDTGETTIVDLKSNDRAQPEEVTELQLHIYALGYQELTGRRPDLVEIYELDDRRRKPRSVDDDFLDDVRKEVRRAAGALREGTLAPTPSKKRCGACDYRGLCRRGA